MSAPIVRSSSECKIIPKRILITDATDIPCSYSSTPGGTLFSTTPGGTKIVYERAFLMNLRNSPISRTPPRWELPDGVLKSSPPKVGNVMNGNKLTKKSQLSPKSQNNNNHIKQNGNTDDSELFQLEI